MVFTVLLSGNMQETIKFQLGIKSEHWDRYPMIDISVDGEIRCKRILDQSYQIVEFDCMLDFDNQHTLSIKRYNKSDDQCVVMPDGSRKDQYIIIDKVIIDGIDIQNLIWHRSWFEPDYPNAWAQQQYESGIWLETKVIGETWLSHNGTWFFEFTSPFYKFVISQFEE